MKALPLVGFLVLAATIAEKSSLMAVDRLSEVKLARFPKYRALWLSKLGPTAFDYGRMMAEPASAPEYSVSVYSQQLQAGQVKYFVTYIIADRSLWDSSDVGKRPEDGESAKTRRIDCQIPREIAEKVKQVWLGMLSGKQRPTSLSAEEAAPSTGEGTIAEFSIQRSGGETLYGEIDADFPPGWKTRTLLDIANDLIAYCKATPADRPAITSKIDQQATALLEQLK
jgi:hypothetical protein